MIVWHDFWLPGCHFILESFALYVYPYIWNIFSTAPNPLLVLTYDDFLTKIRKLKLKNLTFKNFTYLHLLGRGFALTKLLINVRKIFYFEILNKKFPKELRFFFLSKCLVLIVNWICSTFFLFLLIPCFNLFVDWFRRILKTF